MGFNRGFLGEANRGELLAGDCIDEGGFTYSASPYEAAFDLRAFILFFLPGKVAQQLGDAGIRCPSGMASHSRTANWKLIATNRYRNRLCVWHVIWMANNPPSHIRRFGLREMNAMLREFAPHDAP